MMRTFLAGSVALDGEDWLTPRPCGICGAPAINADPQISAFCERCCATGGRTCDGGTPVLAGHSFQYGSKREDRCIWCHAKRSA